MSAAHFVRRTVRRLAAAPSIEQLLRRAGLFRAVRRGATAPPDALVTSSGRGSTVRVTLPRPGTGEFDRLARRASRQRLLTVTQTPLAESTSLALTALAERGVPVWLTSVDPAGGPLDERVAAEVSRPPSTDGDELDRYVRSVRLSRALADAPGRPVSVLLATRRPSMLEHALGHLRTQRDVELQLVLGLHGDWPDDVEQQLARLWHGELVTTRAPSTTSLGGLLRAMSDRADGPFVTKWDDDDWYGPNHIGDLVRAHAVSGAHVVGKAAEFVWLESLGETIRRPSLGARTFSPNLAGGTLLMSRSDLMAFDGFPDAPRSVDRILIDRVRDRGGIVYRTHGLEFVLRRSGSDDHTWAADDRYFLDDAVERRVGLDLRFADIRSDEQAAPR